MLVADDQAVVRRGIAALVGLIDGIDVVATAHDGHQTIEHAVTLRPDVVLLDLRMPGLNGIETTRQLRHAVPHTAVVILTSFSDGESVLAALRAGASGYLTKEADIDEIEAAIVAASAGQSILGPGVRQQLLSVAGPAAMADDPRTIDPVVLAAPEFTPREREVLGLIARGMSNRQIADHLVITEVTVKTHVNRIFAKSGSRDRAQAVRFAFRHGFADG